MASTPAAAQEIFAQLEHPAGVAVDLAGNVFVHHDARFTTLLTKFAPDRRPVGQVSLGGINTSHFLGSRLATDPVSGTILLLTQQGVILQVPPDGAPADFIDLRPWANQVFDGVFDVSIGRYKGWVLANPSYGDIAVYRSANEIMDLFVTGISAGFPFVMRVRVDFRRGVFDPRVIMTTTGTTAGNVNEPSGIAVNQDGWALVTLPHHTPIGFASGLVRFNVAFPDTPQNAQNANLLPQFIIPTGLASLGMTTDTAGNFYIVSGSVGAAVCGPQGSGAMVVISRAFDQISCETFGRVIFRTADVAVSSIDRSVFVTVFDISGGVIRLRPLANAAGTSLSTARH